MSSPELLNKLAAFVPTPVVQAIHQYGFQPVAPTGQRLNVAVLFADISGFTALGELLSQAGRTGAEELTHLINTYYTLIIEAIEAFNGQVVKFSGDALTATFLANEIGLIAATQRASTCAIQIQDVLKTIKEVHTTRGSANPLSMKIGIGVGEILACTVGGILNRWEYVVAGDPLVQVATAQDRAKPNEVILSPQAWKHVSHLFTGAEDRQGFVTLGYTKAQLDISKYQPLNWADISVHARPRAETALKGFIPGAINARLEQQAGWLAELRRMTVLFVGVGGLDYEADDAVDRLQTLVEAVQKTIYKFEASLNKVAVDDKGTVLLLLFGAPPFYHEDDPQRAVACALRLQEIAQTQNLRMSIGITEGAIFAGPVGAETRQEYTVIGDQVNIAARLMQQGRPGAINISQAIKDRIGSRFTLEDLGNIVIKGKKHTLPAYRVVGEEGAELQFLSRYFLHEEALIGRRAYLEAIRRLASRTKKNELQVLLIEGELGLGKSRLSAEMVREWMMDSGAAYGSTCNSYSHQMPYQCWQRILSAIYGLSPDLSAERQLARLASVVAKLTDPPNQPGYWADRLPLLKDIMGINSPETTFTQSLQGELRRNNTFALIEALLRHQAENQPLLILLEDVHWADELSLALVAHLVQTLHNTALFMVLAYRPMNNMPDPLLTIKQHPIITEFQLEPLTQEESRMMLNAVLGNKALPQSSVNLLLNRAQGNPFFIQEAAQTVLSLLNKEDVQVNQIIEALDLSGTVQDAILTRIDRLSDEEKLTLKVASVIGANFERKLLSAVHPVEKAEQALLSQLNGLENEKLIRIETPDPQWEYVFRNVITQEVVYEGLLLAQRRPLHTEIGCFLEKFLPEEIERLAFHYSRSNNYQKGMHYLAMAADKAKREYANQAAIAYLTDMLTLMTNPPTDEDNHINGKQDAPETVGVLHHYDTGLTSVDYWNILHKRAEFYNLVGQQEDEAEDLGTLGILSEALNDRHRRALSAVQWTHFYEAMGDYASGLEMIERAVSLAEETGYEPFIGECYSYWGKLLFLSGNYLTTATAHLEKAFDIAQKYYDKVGQADCLYNRGVILFFQADYEAALADFQQAAKHWYNLEDSLNLSKGLRHLGQTYFQLGQFTAAQSHFEQALTLHRKIGDSVGEALTQNLLGQVATKLGNFDQAKEILSAALTVHQTAENRPGEIECKIQLGFLYNRLNDQTMALSILEAVIETIRELDAPWLLSTALTYYSWTLIEAGRHQESQAYLQEGLRLQRDFNPGTAEAKIMEFLALLGRAALIKNDLSLATTCAQHALRHLKEHGTAGVEYPARVYLTVYEILSQKHDMVNADIILQEAATYILGQADQLVSPSLRHAYLNNIPENKTIYNLHLNQ